MNLTPSQNKYLIVFLLLSQACGQGPPATTKAITKDQHNRQLENFRFLTMDSLLFAWSDTAMLFTDLNKNIKYTIFASKEYGDENASEQEFEESDVVPEDSLHNVEAQDKRSYSDEDEPGDYESYSLLSVVEDIISVSYSYYFGGGAHRYYGSYTKIFELKKNTPETLLELFDEIEVVKALKNDSIINSLYPSLDCENYHTCIDSLESGKYRRAYLNLDCAPFSEMGESFYIYDYHEGVAIVRFDLPGDAGCHYAQNFSFSLEIKARKDKVKFFEKMLKDGTSYKLLSVEKKREVR